MNEGFTRMSEKQQKYCGPITISLCRPIMQILPLIQSSSHSLLSKILDASQRRCFNLTSDWIIKLENVDYMPELNGCLKIPHELAGEKIKLDGASVPATWLASFITLGVVRPMGVMLYGSIIHDFAYQHGYLLISKDEDLNYKKVKITRDVADKLFKDIIICVNKVPFFGWLSWFLVRIGWITGVPFHRKRWGAPAPIGVIATVCIILTTLTFWLFDRTNFLEERFNYGISFTFLSLLLIYLAIEIIRRSK